MSHIIVPMSLSEVLYCEEQGKISWAATDKRKIDVFSKGCMEGEPWLPPYYGFLGEVAFSKIIGIPAQIERKHGGDRGDFILPLIKPLSDGRPTRTIDVKFTTSPVLYENSVAGYIRAEDARGNPVPTPYDFYVFCSIYRRDQDGHPTEIAINGYLKQSDLAHIDRKPSTKDSHVNLVPRKKDLRDIRFLIAGINRHCSKEPS